SRPPRHRPARRTRSIAPHSGQSPAFRAVPISGAAQSAALCRAQLVPGSRRPGCRAGIRRVALGVGPKATLGVGADAARRLSPGGVGPPGRYDSRSACPSLSRAGARLPADGLAYERGTGRRAAPGRDADRRGGWQGGLDRLSRSVSAGVENVDRGQASRAAGRSDGAAADDPAAVGGAAPKRPGGKRQGGFACGEGKGVAEACSEDGVMVPQIMPMLAVPAEPFDSPEYCFEVKYDGVRALAAVENTGWRLWG